MDISIRVAGEAGQGVQSAGELLVRAFAGMGLHVFATKSYMSRIRGGLNWFDVRIADRELFAGKGAADLLVALTPAALEVLRDQTAGGLILFDGEQADGAAAIPFTQAAKQIGSAVMANSVAAGAVFAVLGYDPQVLCELLRRQYRSKGDEVAEANAACALRGAELAGPHAGRYKAPQPAGAPASVCAGAEAIGLAAATAGVKFVTGYPMTPGTATLQYLAAMADKYGIVVEQAEDEIAAINMVCGAAYAGVPAMTATSGGGFALMAEGLSLAGICELPAVIVIAQRPGPATGLPTRTAQQDLLFALHAGHGEFARAVYAPGTHAECYELTRLALQTAHRFQTPAIVLTDQFLQDAEKNIPPLDDSPRPIDRCIVQAAEGYLRYAVTEDGVSPRAIPGGDAPVVVDSDEHGPDGHLTEDLQIHMDQQDKRMRKLRGLTADARPPSLHGPADAPALLICWGSTYGPCREAVDAMNTVGEPAAMLHFSQVWPLNAEAARAAIGRRDRLIVVEGNATGQFASMLRAAGLIGSAESCLRYDGLPFNADQIVSHVRH